jgi:hypothetical protein
MNAGLGPDMSVVITTRENFKSIETTIQYLLEQTVSDRIELVIVAPSEEQLSFKKSLLKKFWGYQVVSVGQIDSIGSANAEGIRRARGEVVALAEDHCFPEPGWAAALISAHSDVCVGIGPVIRNANPTTMVSWCDFLIGYCFWMEPMAAAQTSFIPGHNSSYKRSVLIEEYGDQLGDMLESETVMHLDLCRKGYRLRIEPAARTAHVNFSLLSSWFPVQYLAGRVFAGNRIRSWSVARRLIYGIASPLIPIVRLFRISRELTRPGRPSHLSARLMPLLILGLLCDGLGQMIGYLSGPGNATEKLGQFEFNRIDHITEEDRRSLFMSKNKKK